MYIYRPCYFMYDPLAANKDVNTILILWSLYDLHWIVVFCLKQVTQIDTDLKSKSQAYNTVRGNLQNIERKAL
jgi:V-ATPase subunit C